MKHTLILGGPKPLFELGQAAVSAGVDELVKTTTDHVELAQAFARHATGDWGDMPPDDCEQNKLALEHGSRLMSAYTVAGKTIWIFTEADRSVTTAILPDEY